MKIKFNPHDELRLNETITICTMTVIVSAIFIENNKHYTSFLGWMSAWNIKMEREDELKEIDTKVVRVIIFII